MKIRTYIIAVLAAMLSFSGCNFLEAPPSTDLNEDKVFSDRTLCERFITGIYAEGMPLGFSMNSDNIDRGLCATSTRAGACDEGEAGASWDKANASWNTDNHNNNSIDWDEDPRHDTRWATIRKCNTLLERIDEVPYDPGDPEFNSRAKGEGYFMRAISFWEGVYRYGGLPIVDHRITGSEDAKYPRNTFSECIDFIVKDCDEAAKLLPDKYTNPAFVGRATRIAALALKSRVLLYAASPLFNTATPYLSLGGENNKIIGYGNYDAERWKKAADAAKEAIDAAEAAGYALYDKGTPETNYEYVWTTPDNCEIILANKKYRNFSTNTKPITSNIPQWAGSSWSDGGLFAPLNFVKKYEKRDGTEQEWLMSGGDDLLKKYSELDPRFAQTIAYQGAVWNDEIGKLDFLEGGAHQVAYDKTRHLVRKWVPRTLKATYPHNSVNMDWIVFRMAELYLNYAEAVNEFQGPTAEAVAAVSKVRNRSGMPAFPSTLTKSQFREKLRNERAVELAYEDHRFWDIRRWMIAENEGVMQGKFYGLQISRIEGSSEVHYKPYVFENRLWSRRSYLHPIKQLEVDKGYLIQNPGWE